MRDDLIAQIASFRTDFQQKHIAEIATIREEHALEVTKLREEITEMRKLHESTLALLVSFASQTETKLAELSQN